MEGEFQEKGLSTKIKCVRVKESDNNEETGSVVESCRDRDVWCMCDSCVFFGFNHRPGVLAVLCWLRACSCVRAENR